MAGPTVTGKVRDRLLKIEELDITLDDIVASFQSRSDRKLRLSKYRLLRVLGRGSMGAVFEATDMLLKRPVALKVFPQRFRGGESSDTFSKFVREASSAARVDHPHVVRVYEINLSGGWLFIAMERIEGANLKEVLAESKKLPVRQACALIADAAQALAKAHQHGIVHRDIKPANLVLTAEGQCKVADFGLAYAASEAADMPRESVGTPYYIAPEVALKLPATPASDIYSLGATLWHLLEGRALYEGDKPRQVVLQHIKGPTPDLKSRMPELPQELVDTLYVMLRRDPQQRCQDAEEIAQRLRLVAEGRVDDPDVEAPLRALAEALVEPVKPFNEASSRSATARRRTRHSEQQQSSRTPLYLGAGLVAVAVVAAVVAVFLLVFNDTNQTSTSSRTSSSAGVVHAPSALSITTDTVSQRSETSATPRDAPTLANAVSSDRPSLITAGPLAQTGPVVAGVVVEQQSEQADSSPEPPSASQTVVIDKPHAQPVSPSVSEQVGHEQKTPATIPSPPSALRYEVRKVIPAENRESLMAIITEADEQKYGVYGVVTSAKLSRSGKTFRIHLNDTSGNQAFVASSERALTPKLAETFGGAYGEGLLGKRVIILGPITRFFSSPQIKVNDPSQIQILE